MASKSNGTRGPLAIACAWFSVDGVEERAVQLQRSTLVFDKAGLDEGRVDELCFISANRKRQSSYCKL